MRNNFLRSPNSFTLIILGLVFQVNELLKFHNGLVFLRFALPDSLYHRRLRHLNETPDLLHGVYQHVDFQAAFLLSITLRIATNTFQDVAEQADGRRINQKNFLEGQAVGSAVRQTLFLYFCPYGLGVGGTTNLPYRGSFSILIGGSLFI